MQVVMDVVESTAQLLESGERDAQKKALSMVAAAEVCARLLESRDRFAQEQALSIVAVVEVCAHFLESGDQIAQEQALSIKDVGIPSVQTQTTLKQKKGREGKRLNALCAKQLGRMVVEITVKSTPKPEKTSATDKALVMMGVEKDSVNTVQRRSGIGGEG
jgi:hypothetical protein